MVYLFAFVSIHIIICLDAYQSRAACSLERKKYYTVDMAFKIMKDIFSVIKFVRKILEMIGTRETQIMYLDIMKMSIKSFKILDLAPKNLINYHGLHIHV